MFADAKIITFKKFNIDFKYIKKNVFIFALNFNNNQPVIKL